MRSGLNLSDLIFPEINQMPFLFSITNFSLCTIVLSDSIVPEVKTSPSLSAYIFSLA